MLIEALVLSVIVAYLQGGKLRNLRKERNKTLHLLFIGLLLTYLLSYLSLYSSWEFVDKLEDFAGYIFIISFLFIGVGTFINREFRSLFLIFLGQALNMLVMALNSLKIPMVPQGLELVGRPDLMDSVLKGEGLFIGHGRLDILGKIVVFSKPYFLAKIISIGDIIVAIGFFIFIRKEMLRTRSFLR